MVINRNIKVLGTKSFHNLRSNIPSYLASTSFSIHDELRRHSLSELLPYDSQTKSGDRLLAGLKEYDFLLTAAETTAELINKGHISEFDPLVGENACQIRALKNCMIFSTHPVDGHKLLAKIDKAKQKTHAFFKNLSTFSNSDFSLYNFLENNDTDIQLTHNEIYLIQSYLLTVVKTIKPPKKDIPFVKNEYTDTKKLKSIKPIGTMFAENLIKKLRESLSASSVSFIQEISSRIANEALNNAILDDFYVRYNRLHCLPCYWATKLLMVQALISQIPLVIIARQLAKDRNYDVLNEAVLPFSPTLSGYMATSLNLLNLKAPSLVLLVNSCRETSEFSALTAWKNELLQYNPIDLILAYAAAHRQYPDATKEGLVNQIQDEQYKFYKAKAIEWGCSIEKPFGFFLSHAFCDKIENISNHLSLQHELQSCITKAI